METAPAAGAERTEEPDTLSKRVKRWISSPWTIGLLVIGLIWALFQVAPPSEWQDAFRQAEPSWLLAAVLLVLPHELLKVLRMEQLVPEVKSCRLLHAKIVYSMSCVAQLPVGTVGGDVYRVMRLEECGADTKDATAATFLMRAVGFATTTTISGIAGFILLDSVLPLLGIVIGAAILYLLATSKNPPRFLGALVKRADETGEGRWGRFVSAAARLLRHVFDEAAALTRPQILRVLAITLALYGVRAAIVWFSLLSLDLDISYLASLGALAVGNLASSIPSPAGNVGLREGGMVGVLAGLGVAVAPATIGALLFRAVIIIGAGVGLILTTIAHAVTGKQAA